MVTVPNLEITAQDALLDVWRHPDTPPTVVPTWSVDNTRGELDALRIGRDVIIVHGGSFEGGPTYWVTAPGVLGPAVGAFIPDEPPTFHDTTEAMRATLNAWVSARISTTEGIKP